MNAPEMDGIRFTADSIGYSALSKPTTGIGALQQPIKELYLKYKKPGGNNAKKVLLRISQNGLSVVPVDGSKGEIVHDLNSITHTEAVKFTLLSGNEKKMRAMFLPLEDSRVPPNKDKSVFSVDKSYQFFKQINHPPLFACVLRRPKGVKALDCHVFVMETPDDALQVVSLINQMESGGYNMEYIGDRPRDGSFNRGQRNDVIRTEYGEYSVYTGSKFDLKDDYFRPQDGAAVTARPHPNAPGEEHAEYDWNYRRHVVSMDDGWQKGEGGQYCQEEQYLGSSRPASSYESSRMGYNYERPDFVAHERPDFVAHERPDFVAHERQGSAGSGEGRVINRSFHESAGARFEENIERGQRFPSSRVNQPIRNSDIIPPKVAEKPHKFENLNRPMPLRPTSPQMQPPQGPLSARDRESPRSPIGMDSPRSPQSPTPPAYSQQLSSGRSFHQNSSAPAFSMSNRENVYASQTSQEDVPQQKPIAKVPPHLMTGVKVLPTDFSAIKLKSRPAKSSFDDDEHDYDNNVNIRAKVKSYREEEETQSRAYHYTDASSDPPPINNHKSQQPAYRDENNTTRIHNFSSNYVNYEADDRRYIEQYDDDVKQRQQYDHRPSDNRSSQNRHSSAGYGYEPSRNQWEENQGANDSIPPQGYEGGRPQFSGRPPSAYGSGQGGQAPPNKEAEIASMFTNMHVQREQPPVYLQNDTNFERSLGYFP